MSAYTITKLNMSNRPADADFEWALHKAGCADLDPTNHEDFTDDATSVEAAVTDWIDPEVQELGWTNDDVRVMPCTDQYRADED